MKYFLFVELSSADPNLKCVLVTAYGRYVSKHKSCLFEKSTIC